MIWIASQLPASFKTFSRGVVQAVRKPPLLTCFLMHVEQNWVCLTMEMKNTHDDMWLTCY